MRYLAYLLCRFTEFKNLNNLSVPVRHCDRRDDADPRVRVCVGSAKSTMGAEALVLRHNKSPQRQ